MPTVVIIGASRGIGLELARQYASAGWRVHATTRTLEKPGPLGTLGGDLELHRLDVRESDQIERLAGALADEPIDVLIHNAGIYGNGVSREEVMRINANAPIRVTQTLLDKMKPGANAKVVLMSSQLGARRGNSASLGVYGDSKAALNDKFRELAPAWRNQGVTAIVMHPGWVRTDMGGAGAPLSVEQSVDGIRRVIARLEPHQHGRFLTWEGREHPW